jgi:segregation and condensation protein B
MDDISREVPPDDTGAPPVSERQKGPEELVEFERGHVGEADGVEDPLALVDRLTGAGAQLLSDRQRPADDGRGGVMAASTPEDGEPAEPAQQDAAAANGSPEDAPLAEGDVHGEDAHGEDVHGEDVHGGGLDVGAGNEGAGGEDHCEPVDADLDEIDVEAAEAAVAAEASTVSVEQDLDELVDAELGEDGLPVVPELTDPAELSRVLFVLMLSSRDGMTVFRLAQACNTSQKLVEEALGLLQEQLRGLSLPVELTRVGDTVRWMSTATAFSYLQRLRGVKKLEKLSPAALETLAVVAYQQPVMRSEIEAIRGVKAGPMLRTLLQHKLVKVAGRADVPGRPLQYGTTPHFLERFGLSSLDELPSVKEWKNLG